jgi:nucleotide-binding universal stress UspA family protein
VKHDPEYFARYRWLGLIQAGCQFAASLAIQYHAKVTVLHAYHPVPLRLGEPYDGLALATVFQEAQALVDDVVELLCKMRVAEVDQKVLEGPASEAILRVVGTRKPDLLVIGGRGMNSWQGLPLGSVSMAVTQRAECPVLVVK